MLESLRNTPPTKKKKCSEEMVVNPFGDGISGKGSLKKRGRLLIYKSSMSSFSTSINAILGPGQMGQCGITTQVSPIAGCRLPGEGAAKYFSHCKGMCYSVWVDLAWFQCFVISLLSQNKFPFQRYEVPRTLIGSFQALSEIPC